MNLNELEAGVYARTTDGLLWKPKKIEIDEDGCYLFDGYYYFEPEQIYKSSHNIIDLISVGDYVNGSRVVNIYQKDSVVIEKTEWIKEDDGTIWDDCIEVNVAEIKSIVTKEQFKSVEYEVHE